MHKEARIIVVPLDQVDSFPVAVKEFVTEYFQEQNILGRTCLVAFGATSLGRSNRKGVAPAHHVDQMRFKLGLDGKTLSEWIDTAAKQGVIWQYSADWDDGCIGPLAD